MPTPYRRTRSIHPRTPTSRIVHHLRKVETSKENIRVPKAVISPRRLVQFWKEYDAGKRRSVTRHMSHEEWALHAAKYARTRRKHPWFMEVKWRREPVAVTPSVLGTVRTFDNQDVMDSFLRRVRSTNSLFRSARKFDFQPTYILGIRGLELLEQVFRAPNIANLKWRETQGGLYLSVLMKKLQRKQVDMNRFATAVEAAMVEAKKLVHDKSIELNKGIHGDLQDVNILVLDYNPKTNKPLLAFVDHGGSQQL